GRRAGGAGEALVLCRVGGGGAAPRLETVDHLGAGRQPPRQRIARNLERRAHVAENLADLFVTTGSSPFAAGAPVKGRETGPCQADIALTEVAVFHTRHSPHPPTLVTIFWKKPALSKTGRLRRVPSPRFLPHAPPPTHSA